VAGVNHDNSLVFGCFRCLFLEVATKVNLLLINVFGMRGWLGGYSKGIRRGGKGSNKGDIKE
jgi:hypothetical protein